jgi:hypothetical protein
MLLNLPQHGTVFYNNEYLVPDANVVRLEKLCNGWFNQHSVQSKILVCYHLKKINDLSMLEKGRKKRYLSV